jgi:bacterioferritin-associated ferredoxin
MYVCSCFAITAGQIREAVENGVLTFAELSKKTGLGTRCHICPRGAKAIFNRARQRKSSQGVPPLVVTELKR